MSEEKEIKFEVTHIERARKDSYYVAIVSYKGNSKEYSYVRKGHDFKDRPESYIVISGVQVHFNTNTFQVIKYEKEYDTQGYKRYSSISEKVKHEVQENDIEIPKVEWNPDDFDETEVKHEKYNQIKTCMECGLPIYLAGPAGAGKNFTIEQIAEELGWNFYFSNAIQQEYKLTGFIDAGGEYHETEFYKACTDENDCVFFLDELDASIPDVLVLLNAAIANGYFEFPTGRVNLDKVHFIAAGNTVGSGADDMYTGRSVIDMSTLDRFVIIEFGYDKNIERFLAKGNMDLVNFIEQLRKISEETGIRATFSYRCIKAVTVLEQSKSIELKEIIRIAVVKGLDRDTVLSMNMPTGNGTKYHRAFSALKSDMRKEVA